MRRELECECCGKPVAIVGRQRFLQMVRSKQKPLCNQCRRYIRHASGVVAARLPGTARTAESVVGPSLVALGLTPKRGRGANRMTPLASQSLGRYGVSGYESSAEVGG